ncbi:FAD-binding oxidoreductase [Actinomadura fibrosa]|uniref:FAD-binding oxidoreductase n=1 Tax=Actinomadura fibrosa TaxID=111802 RepID=A0ABW2Y397_9ACTN|nr:FAD-binding oxidoreductase [Actinomadura fibrosa]
MNGPSNWSSLRRALGDRLVLPSDAGYATAAQSALRQFDGIRPQAVAFCETAEEVRTVLGFAQDHGLPAVPRSGGHSYGGHSTTTGMVLDVSRINGVSWAGANAVVGAGAQQVDTLRTLASRGQALVGGVCPNVALGGFVQGGGLGWLTRRFGLASDRLAAASVVLPDGRSVRASEREHPDLFWALQGNGGGNFGVVTGYELAPVELASMVMYHLAWPWDGAAGVIEGWMPWALAAPRELAASVTVVHGDDPPGDPMLEMHGAFLGGEDALDRRLDALIASLDVRPLSRSVKTMTYYDAMMASYMCEELTVEQCHRVGYSPEAMLPRENFFQHRNRMFREALAGAQVASLLDGFGDDRPKGQFRLLYIDVFGGAASDRDRTATAYVHRDAQVLAGFAVSLTDPGFTAKDVAVSKEWLAAGFAALDPGSMHESYQNFMDPDLVDWRESYYAENLARLREVRRRYDPHRFFRFERAID